MRPVPDLAEDFFPLDQPATIIDEVEKQPENFWLDLNCVACFEDTEGCRLNPDVVKQKYRRIFASHESVTKPSTLTKDQMHIYP